MQREKNPVLVCRLTFNSSGRAKFLDIMRSFKAEIGSRFSRTSWISSRVR